MAHKIGIYYQENKSGVDAVMSSPQVEALERQIMMQKKSEVEAAFLQTFGTPGAFKFSVVRTSHAREWNGTLHGNRVIFRIIPDSAKTYALLRKKPGWLNQFV